MENKIVEPSHDWSKDSNMSLVTNYLSDMIRNVSGNLDDIFSVILGYSRMCFEENDHESIKENLMQVLKTAEKGIFLANQLRAISELSKGYMIYSFDRGVKNENGK